MAGKRYVNLKTPRDVTKFLSKLINQVLRKEIDAQVARDVGYLSKILLDGLEKTELQGEIERIKKKLGIGNEPDEGTHPH
jgi:DNA-binding transcriptional regulator GbsR (MarR family)